MQERVGYGTRGSLETSDREEQGEHEEVWRSGRSEREENLLSGLFCV